MIKKVEDSIKQIQEDMHLSVEEYFAKHGLIGAARAVHLKWRTLNVLSYGHVPPYATREGVIATSPERIEEGGFFIVTGEPTVNQCIGKDGKFILTSGGHRIPQEKCAPFKDDYEIIGRDLDPSPSVDYWVKWSKSVLSHALWRTAKLLYPYIGMTPEDAFKRYMNHNVDEGDLFIAVGYPKVFKCSYVDEDCVIHTDDDEAFDDSETMVWHDTKETYDHN